MFLFYFLRDTRPVFLELPLWPKLNFDGDPGTCPFDTRVRDKKVNKEESVSLLNKEKVREYCCAYNRFVDFVRAYIYGI